MSRHNFNVVHFGSELSNTYTALRALQRRKGYSNSVDSFLRTSGDVIREEFRNQSKPWKEQLPTFDSIFDLAEKLQRREIPSYALKAALGCVAQLAVFLSFLEGISEDTLQREHTCFTGYGLGLLPAAAVASCRSSAKLSSMSPEIVRIVLRTGFLVNSVSQQVQASDESTGWSMTVSDATESTVRDELSIFNESKRIPSLSRAYLSGVNTKSVTISGPPSSLKLLFEVSEYFKGKDHVPSETFGLYNASHLYEFEDVQDILDPSVMRIPHKNERYGQILSSASGLRFAEPNVNKLLEQVLVDILLRRYNWDAVLDAAVTSVANSGRRNCHVLSSGTTPASTELATAIQSRLMMKTHTEDLVSWTSRQTATEKTSKAKNPDKIAIIGMAGRYPGANDCEGLWKVLEEGLDMHRKVPSDRFDVETHVDPSGAKRNTSHTPFGCFIEDPGQFDARFFSMSPREAAQTDPMHRLAIMTAYEALEMSGYVPNRTPSTTLSRIGTFYGQTSDDWREINAAQKIETFYIPGGVRAFAPGRINYHFKFSGPSYSVDTACSSSLAAIQVACSSLRSRECDMAVSGGLNVLTNSDIFAGLSRGQFLSKNGPCKVFDADADGYCRADGAGTVILKRLEDAEADNDNILGVILGCATNHSADAISITHPHAASQAYLYQNVLNSAGIDPLDISYVEMHGTGTQAGDTNEIRSVTDVFAPENRHRSQPLHLGAVKANVGHSEAAAGITGLLKILLMLKKNTIPRHIGIKTTINPKFPQNLAARNVQIPFENVPWQSDKRRLSFLNNFSAAGGNTALLLEESPQRTRPHRMDPRSTHVIAVSAKSIASLKKNVESLIAYVTQNPGESLPSLAYTTCARRLHHNYRVAVAVSNTREILTQLASTLEKPLIPVPSSRPRVAFAFTGQGSFYKCLGKRLYATSWFFRNSLQKMNSLAEKQSFESFLPLIEGRGIEVDDKMNSPAVVQLAQVCLQMALADLWALWGITPDAVIGHSLGEYAALYAAGVLSVSDTIHLVVQRASLLTDNCTLGTHAMLAVKGSVSSIETACQDLPYEVACLNSKEETVLSGPVNNIKQLTDTLTTSGLKCTILATPYAFHSSQVDPVLDAFEDIAGGVNFQSPKIPIMSSLLKKTITEPGVIDATYLRRHMREEVDFLGALQEAEDNEIVDWETVFVEIGPHPICAGMIRSHLEDVTVVNSLHRKEDAWLTLSKSLTTLHCAGFKVAWSEVHRDFESAHELLDLPSYSWDQKNYWIDYVGDWSLTKGEVQELPAKPVLAIENVLPLWQRKSKISTSSIHYLLEEDINDGNGTIVVQSDISEPLLNSVVAGHMVNGTALCPSSLYADMALTVGEYLFKQVRPDSQQTGLDVCHMEVTKPLIASRDRNTSQILQVSATATSDSDHAELSFDSVDSNGKQTVQHAKCIVEFRDTAVWLAEWASVKFLVQERVSSLQDAGAKGLVPSITRGLVYKLFGSMVQYDDKYRGMQLVNLNGPKFEATAAVSFQTDEGKFHCSPFWIDSLCHISGFILNASDATDSSKFAFISHGWQYMRFAKQFSNDKIYMSYVKMEAAPGNVYKGNVYILDEEEIIIAVVGGLKFQQIPRTLLNQMLPPLNSPAASVGKTPKGQQQAVAPRPQQPKTDTQAPARNPGTFTKDLIAPKPLVPRVLELIAESAEVELIELNDSCSFADLGIDSLFSLTTVGRLREELDIEVPGSLFLDYPTVKTLKGFLSKIDKSDEPISKNFTASTSASSSPKTEMTTAPSTPDEDSTGVLTPAERDSADVDVIRAEIANQMGVPIEEIVGSTDLGDLGMDSLMSLSILGALREGVGLDLSPDFFLTYPSIDKIEKFMNVGSKALPKAPPPEVLPVQKSGPIDYKLFPPAKSILLQGKSSASKKLFLFPDGSGIAAAYATIPNISPSLAVYGFNCPFMTTPQDFTIGITGVATIYLAELRRRQPSGPYLLGGWSAGGIIAYEVMQQLMKAGETVDRLILLDTPCPRDIVALPPRLHHFFNDIGLLGEPAPQSKSKSSSKKKNKIPDWLLPHFEACIKALVSYEPVPIVDLARCPKIFAIWARHGVCRSPSDPKPPFPTNEPPHLKWLLENRTDFGANGWDALVPAKSFIGMEVLDGNHFSIMRNPTVKMLGPLIKKAIEL